MIKMLLDTDLGSDCDDAGALALLHHLADQEKVQILAVTHCASEITGAIAVKAINKWYGREVIPVGRYQERVFLADERCRCFTKVIAERYMETAGSVPEFEDAVRVMRRALADQEGVTMAAIGPLNNIALLLKSEPDDISPYSGLELIRKSVSSLYVMGGNFGDFSQAEYNIQCDVDSARYVAEYFPVPVIYCGFEIGVKIHTGSLLREAASENPVKTAYDIFTGGLRESWDPVTVYCAVMQDELCVPGENLSIRFDEAGRAVCSPGGKDAYLVMNRTAGEITEVIDSLIY